MSAQTTTQARPSPLPEGARIDPLTGRGPFGYNPAKPVGPNGTGGENPAILAGTTTDKDGRLTAPADAHLESAPAAPAETPSPDQAGNGGGS